MRPGSNGRDRVARTVIARVLELKEEQDALSRICSLDCHDAVLFFMHAHGFHRTPVNAIVLGEKALILDVVVAGVDVLFDALCVR